MIMMEDNIAERIRQERQENPIRGQRRRWRTSNIGGQRPGVMEDIADKVRSATVNYHPSRENFNKNATRAAIGGLATFVASAVSPVLGAVALGYTGVKCYQAYRDSQLQGGN